MSQYVRLAAAGQLCVTDRDRVVAELGPPDETRSQYPADALLADLIRNGWLVPPAVPGTGTPPKVQPVASLSDILDELRGDRDGR